MSIKRCKPERSARYLHELGRGVLLTTILCISSTAHADITVNINGSCVDDPPLNDGFGWNGTGSCQVSAQNRTGTLLIASVGSCIDTVPLNDGYGWNGSSSCDLHTVDASNTGESGGDGNIENAITVNVNGSCVDDPPLNDGFGWNGIGSCQVSAQNRTGTRLIAAIGNCIDTVPLNDGFGWNGSSSCDLPPIGSSDDGGNNDDSANNNAGNWWQPKASDNLKWQIQLQGDIRLINGVDVYAVDYTASQASINAAKSTGAKIMCYISAGSAENWRPDYNQIPRSVIGNAYSEWPGEWWLDTRNINALAPVMRARMDACKSKGFDAIDSDNVNGFENNTGFNISRSDSIRYIRWLADEAHQRGMAFSLKNSETLVAELLGDIDMMQSESCYRYGNCDNAGRLSAVNKPVFAVEYPETVSLNNFRNGACTTAARLNLSMVYRDRLLTPNGIYESCNQ